MPLRVSEHNMRRFRGNGVADRGQLPSGRRLESSGSRVNLSPAQRLISSGLARLDDDHIEQDNAKTSSWKESGAESDSTLCGPAEDADEESNQPWRYNPDSIQDATGLRENTSIGSSHSRATTAKKRPSRPAKPSRQPSLGPDKETYLSTSRLYRTTLGMDFDWEKAVKAVTPEKKVTKAKDTSRDAVESPSVARLVEALRADNVPSTQYLFRLYRDIPSPGVAQLSKRSRGVLMRRFANPPSRRWVDARRYLALVEDMVTAGLPISRSLWSSAIHLAGRANGKVLKRDLVRAIGLWQQMEHVAGIMADDVVFNILFDIAIKAGQFSVADRLQKEMTRRGIDFSRCGKVSKIYFHGLQKDVEGIRRTFDAFVKSGELVDTVVLNCLNAAFLRAGEVQTAEQLYARMLEAHENARRRNPSSADHDSEIRPTLSSEFTAYRTRTRKLGRLLKKSMALKERLPEYHRALQDALPMTPDTRTFYTFLRHYAYHSGQLDSFMAVLRDMETTFVVPPRAIIYLFLFEGFAVHGRRKKQWSAERLRLTWHAYLRALHDSEARLNGLNLHTPKLVWENPLASSVSTSPEPEMPVTDSPDGLYMSLPSATTEAKSSSEERPEDSQETTGGSTNRGSLQDDEDHATEEKANESEYDETAEREDLDVDEVFSTRLASDHRAEPELEQLQHLENRVENGVFIGRRMIIVILRAFGTCCGPKEVLDVWIQLERLWHPRRRKVVDILSIKEELDEQMSRDPPRM